MLSQVQENWAMCGEPFEFALCIRVPYCEVLPRLTVGQLPIAFLFIVIPQANTSIHFH